MAQQGKQKLEDAKKETKKKQVAPKKQPAKHDKPKK